MMKRTCACSVESGARGAPGGPDGPHANGLNLNRESDRPVTLERKSRIRIPASDIPQNKSNACSVPSTGAAARNAGICVAPRNPPFTDPRTRTRPRARNRQRARVSRRLKHSSTLLLGL